MLFLGFSWPKHLFLLSFLPFRPPEKHHHVCKSLGITKYDPYFTDAETKAWEEWAPNQGFLPFWGLRDNKPLCTCRAFSIFVLLGNHQGRQAFICSLVYCGLVYRLQSQTYWIQTGVHSPDTSLYLFPQIAKQQCLLQMAVVSDELESVQTIWNGV